MVSPVNTSPEGSQNELIGATPPESEPGQPLVTLSDISAYNDVIRQARATDQPSPEQSPVNFVSFRSQIHPSVATQHAYLTKDLTPKVAFAGFSTKDNKSSLATKVVW